MSQQNYPEYGFGLVLSGKEIDNFINRTKVENPYELQEIDEFGGFARYYDEECEGKSFTSISHDYLEDEPMLAFWATHLEKIDDCFFGADFENTDYLAAKEAKRIGFCKIIPVKELPKGFDMRYFGWIDTLENRKAIENYYNRY